MSQPITIGVGGPVGSGKSLLVERIVPLMIERGFSPGVVPTTSSPRRTR